MEKRTALAPEELAGLYRRHIQMVYQICLLMLKNVPDAEDAAQTVFRKRLERGPALQDPEREKAWLIVAARNECRDQLKHWWRTRRAGEESLRALSCPPPEGDDLREQIWALPEKYRLALYLHYYQGYTAQETAEILGENPSTVRTWLVQARKKLKERWEAEHSGRS